MVLAALTEHARPWNSTIGDPEDVFDLWISPKTRILYLGTILPGVVVLSTILYDLVSTYPWPHTLWKIAYTLKSPFRDFLTLRDLDSELGPAQKPPAWKTRALVALATLAAAGWVGVLAYGIFGGQLGEWELLRADAQFFGWVSPRSFS